MTGLHISSTVSIIFTVGNWWTTGQLDFKVAIVPQILEGSCIIQPVKGLPSYKAVHDSRNSSKEYIVFSFQLMKVHRLKHLGFKFMVDATNELIWINSL